MRLGFTSLNFLKFWGKDDHLVKKSLGISKSTFNWLIMLMKHS